MMRNIPFSEVEVMRSITIQDIMTMIAGILVNHQVYKQVK